MNNSVPLVGTWTFTHAIAVDEHDILNGCYRPKSFPWYLQPFPSWTVYIIVPVFSTLSSLANLQSFKSKQLPIMVVISCASYASNKIANHYIFNRSDVVSAIGAFTVGLLGNIYSRKMGGTAFTSMVTGVLFLVPVSTSVGPLEVQLIWHKVWPVSSWRNHSQWERYRHRRCYDCCYDWNHCWTIHEPGSCLCLWQSKECCCIFFLIFVFVLYILARRRCRSQVIINPNSTFIIVHIALL